MLTGPMEILELRDKEFIELSVSKFEVDQGFIRPAHAPQGKTIQILRLHVPKEIKPLFPHYYDVTSTGAIAQLLPILEKGNFQSKRFTIRAAGDGVRKRYSVEVSR